MTDHPVATREEWLAARRRVLDAEKELTRRSDFNFDFGVSFTEAQQAAGRVSDEIGLVRPS